MLTETKGNGHGNPVTSAFPQAVPRRSNVQAISSALSFLLSQQQGGHWSDFSLADSESDVWVTAHVLARLGEIPSYFLSNAMRVQVRTSLDWLLAARTPEGAWGHSSGAEADADSTAWAVIALRRHGRKVPETALDLVRDCARPDGGTAACPETSAAGDSWKLSAPDVTAMAANALRNLVPPRPSILIPGCCGTGSPSPAAASHPHSMSARRCLTWAVARYRWPLRKSSEISQAAQTPTMPLSRRCFCGACCSCGCNGRGGWL
jgi:hypothetical protein